MRFLNALLVIAAVLLGASNQVAAENVEVSSPLHRLLFEISRYEAHVLGHHDGKNTAVAVGAVAANSASVDQANVVSKSKIGGYNDQSNSASVSQQASATNTGAVTATAKGKGRNTAVAAGAVAANSASVDQANVVSKSNIGGNNQQSNTASVSQQASATNSGAVTATAGGN